MKIKVFINGWIEKSDLPCWRCGSTTDVYMFGIYEKIGNNPVVERSLNPVCLGCTHTKVRVILVDAIEAAK